MLATKYGTAANTAEYITIECTVADTNGQNGVENYINVPAAIDYWGEFVESTDTITLQGPNNTSYSGKFRVYDTYIVFIDMIGPFDSMPFSITSFKVYDAYKLIFHQIDSKFIPDKDIIKASQIKGLSKIEGASAGYINFNAGWQAISIGVSDTGSLVFGMGDIYPEADYGTTNLGMSSHKFNNLYLAGDISDGTNSDSVTDIITTSTNLSSATSETWTFTLSDNTTVTKTVVVK